MIYFAQELDEYGGGNRIYNIQSPDMASISKMCIKLQGMKQLGQRCCQEGILLGAWHSCIWKKGHKEEIY